MISLPQRLQDQTRPSRSKHSHRSTTSHSLGDGLLHVDRTLTTRCSYIPHVYYYCYYLRITRLASCVGDQLHRTTCRSPTITSGRAWRDTEPCAASAAGSLVFGANLPRHVSNKKVDPLPMPLIILIRISSLLSVGALSSY